MTSSILNEITVVRLAMAWVFAPLPESPAPSSTHAKGTQIFITSNRVEA